MASPLDDVFFVMNVYGCKLPASWLVCTSSFKYMDIYLAHTFN
jgi:hypothetical protein